MYYTIFLKRRFYTSIKPSFHIFFFLFVLQSTFGQNLSLVDQKIETYPYYSNVNSIANKIEEDFPSKLEKIRAVYSWVTKNIKYDLKEFYSGAKQYSFRYSSKEELQRQIDTRNNLLINKTLKRQKAVCEGYSQTFKKICDILEIECKVVSGYTKTLSTEIGHLPLGGEHAWNTVFFNNKWNLIDTTWGAGYVNNSNKWMQQFDDYFFFTNADQFINSHFPKELKWQLLNTPYSSKQFADFPILTPHYFKNRLQLKFPKTGKLINRNNKFHIIKFNSDNISEDFSYAYGNDVYMSSLIPDLIRNETVLKIPSKNKKNTSLNIIVGNDVVLQYQIK